MNGEPVWTPGDKTYQDTGASLTPGIFNPANSARSLQPCMSYSVAFLSRFWLLRFPPIYFALVNRDSLNLEFQGQSSLPCDLTSLTGLCPDDSCCSAFSWPPEVMTSKFPAEATI